MNSRVCSTVAGGAGGEERLVLRLELHVPDHQRAHIRPLLAPAAALLRHRRVRLAPRLARFRLDRRPLRTARLRLRLRLPQPPLQPRLMQTVGFLTTFSLWRRGISSRTQNKLQTIGGEHILGEAEIKSLVC